MHAGAHGSHIIRVLLILVGVVIAHLGVRAVRWLSRRLLSSRLGSASKVHTLTGFAASILVFILYFGAVGLVLNEVGISLTAYLASASVVGLAVSFGSQGVVQDVITGLTLVFADLIDVGDLVNVGGQVGIVQDVGMRFTRLVGFSGESVFVPNRTIATVVSYPRGYIRAYLDARVPADSPAFVEQALDLVRSAARAAYEQYPGVLLVPPTVERTAPTSSGYVYIRVKFRIWPGQGALIEGPIKAHILGLLKGARADYPDYMLSVYYRAEPRDVAGPKALPRPAATPRKSASA
ncbi:MAG: mechanosensitive ion channel [Myxococcales bacterium]|nr:mechanosensitive ion channel [Myxococcales bacterium]